MSLSAQISFRPTAPAIISQPQDLVVREGEPATFTVGTTGSDPLRWQWLRDGVPIPGATAASLTIDPTTLADDAARFAVTITNSAVAAADIVMVSVANGTNTQGTPTVTRVQPAAGQIVVLISNLHASAQALNGTLVVSFAAFGR